jgi:hypothetical protein
MAGIVLRILAAIVVAAIFAGGQFGSDSDLQAVPVSMVLSQQVGEPVSMYQAQVLMVPADEGFWVTGDHGRMWVQIETATESPYTVRSGDLVSFTGRVVANDTAFAGRVGVTTAEGGNDLGAQRAHIEIPVDALTFTAA